MSGLHFADLRPGQMLPPVDLHVTQDAIDRYAVASLDYNPVHTDIEWCKRAQVFGMPDTVGHGMLTMSLMTSVVLNAWYRYGAWITNLEAKFTKPVPAGDTMHATGFVKEVHPLGPGRNCVLVELAAHNLAGETVGVGSARVAIPD